MSKAPVGAARGGGRRRLRALAARDRRRHALLDHVERLDHLADALAGEILEIAGLEQPRDVLLDVLRHAARVAGQLRGGERLGAVVDRLGRLQDLVGRLLHRLDRGAELAGGTRHAAFLALADQRR